MIELIQHVKPSLMEEVRLRCSDSFCDDFDEEIYEQAIFRAIKKVAREYDLLQRYIKFSNKIIINPADDTITEDELKLTDIDLPIKSFRDEYKVTIGSLNTDTSIYDYYLYTKVTDHQVELDQYEYHLYRGLNSWKFNYSPRGTDDEVIIFYIMDPELDDYEDKNTSPVLPGKYDEEVQKRAIIYMAKLGIAKYKEDKKKKYQSIYLLEMKEKGDDKIEPHRAPINIKPFRYPDEA